MTLALLCLARGEADGRAYRLLGPVGVPAAQFGQPPDVCDRVVDRLALHGGAGQRRGGLLPLARSGFPILVARGSKGEGTLAVIAPSPSAADGDGRGGAEVGGGRHGGDVAGVEDVGAGAGRAGAGGGDPGGHRHRRGQDGADDLPHRAVEPAGRVHLQHDEGRAAVGRVIEVAADVVRHCRGHRPFDRQDHHRRGLRSTLLRCKSDGPEQKNHEDAQPPELFLGSSGAPALAHWILSSLLWSDQERLLPSTVTACLPTLMPLPRSRLPFPRNRASTRQTDNVGGSVQDLRLDGMLHARVVRPPGRGSALSSLEAGPVEEMDGVVAVIRDGNFLAVVAEGEFQAIRAMRALQAVAEWSTPQDLPDQNRIYDWLRENETEVGTVAEEGSAEVPSGDRTLRVTFNRPYTMHGSIGPSAAVALMEESKIRIWSHTQGVYPDRTAIAEMLGMPEERIRISHVQGSGCYGHNGADDAAADAALIARALPGRPIRLSWTREQEHGWEPYGSAMTMDVAGAVDADGRIAHWTYDLWSCTHVTRQPGANKLLAANLKSNPIPFELPDILIVPPGLGDRNAVPLYTIPNKRILYHFVKPMPIRTSALRALGAHANVFALESFMDELAILAETDPVEFRLRHLDDPRARMVVEKAAETFGWSSDPLPPNIGRGFAFAQYKNMAAYCAVALTVKVEPETGRVLVRDVAAAVDSGEAVSIDGIRNQIEGGIVQSLSWTLYEEVVFDRARVTSIAAQGPAAAAIGNAVRNATDVRMTTLPLSRDRVVQALGA
jgi:nicotinate dehydrogenase subunit B